MGARASPAKGPWVDLTDRAQPWMDRMLDERRTSLDRSRDLAVHEANADDGDVATLRAPLEDCETGDLRCSVLWIAPTT